MGCAASVEAVPASAEGKRGLLLTDVAVSGDAPVSAEPGAPQSAQAVAVPSQPSVASSNMNSDATVAVQSLNAAADDKRVEGQDALQVKGLQQGVSAVLSSTASTSSAGTRAATADPPSDRGAHAIEQVPAATATSNAERFKDGEVTVVFVLGGPGCGKGTQCARMVTEFGFQHLSAGDLLRAEVQAGSALGHELDAIMKEGGLVPVAVTLRLLRSAMHASPIKRFLIDGFPRAVDQAQAFEAAVAAPSVLLFLECPLETMQARLLKRGEISGRVDDNPATIQKRFDTFLAQSLPVLAHYQQRVAAGQSAVRCHTISSVPPPDQVYDEVAAILRQLQHTFVPGAAPRQLGMAVGDPAPALPVPPTPVANAIPAVPLPPPAVLAESTSREEQPATGPVEAPHPDNAGKLSETSPRIAPPVSTAVGSGGAKNSGPSATPGVPPTAVVALSTSTPAAQTEPEKDQDKGTGSENSPTEEAALA